MIRKLVEVGKMLAEDGFVSLSSELDTSPHPSSPLVDTILNLNKIVVSKALKQSRLAYCSENQCQPNFGDGAV